MSQKPAEYKTDNDDFDLKKHIEQECILGGFNRLCPIVEAASEKVVDGVQGSAVISNYLELERLALDLARYALDYYEVAHKNEH